MMTIQDLLDLSKTIAAPLFAGKTYPWEALDGIKSFILELGETLSADEYDHPEEGVWIAKDAKIFPSAYIGAPCSAIVGKNAVVGNSTELKNVVLFDNVQVPHYNYVGDSILGYKAHMGAGSITSNVKSDKTLVTVHIPDAPIETGRKKFGAMLSDHVEVGCGSILNPGTVIGRNTNVYPLSSVRGCVDADSIYKSKGEGEIVAKH